MITTTTHKRLALLFIFTLIFSATVLAAVTSLTDLRIGENRPTATKAVSTPIDDLWVQSVQIDSGKTSKTVSLLGVSTSSVIVATANTDGTTRSLTNATPGTNMFSLEVDGAVGQDTVYTVFIANIVSE